MLSSTLAAFVTILSSLVATNGAIVQRDGGNPTTSSVSTTVTTSMTTSIPPTTTSSVPVTKTTSIPSITLSTPVTKTVSTTSVPPTTSSVFPSKTTTSVKPTQTVGTVSCDGVQEFQAAFAYTAGDKVILNNQLFTATQWTYNNVPPAHPDQWTLDGTCTQPIHNQANCQGVPAWENDVAYTTGGHVTFNGSLWSAVQWTFANSPGDNSGSWQDLGVCADP